VILPHKWTEDLCPLYIGGGLDTERVRNLPRITKVVLRACDLKWEGGSEHWGVA
jgi:hypothetical protein